MGKALYRTYRSKKLSEIVGQEHITTALVRALKKGTISHAYLFTGPRGVGKTSIARILAHEVNNLPYDEDTNNIDIIEIDAASNRRIDEIRDLREKVHVAPSSAKYKVYIIDEVHMLTKEAFNALLKTLEEPPAHVIFILATTEAHKLPETIISRTQRYTFKPIELSKVTAHLRHIADQEKIEITDEALDAIAKHGEGSFRDSISLLDQVRNTGSKVTLQDVETMLGLAPTDLIVQISESVTAHDTVAVASSLTQMHNQGYEASQVAKQLGGDLRSKLLAGVLTTDHDIVMKLLGTLVQVPASRDPQLALELALLDAALAGSPTAVTQPATPPKVMPEEVGIKPALQVQQIRKAKPKATSTVALDAEQWASILNTLKSDHNTLYSVVKLATPTFTSGTVTLGFNYGFYQKRVNESKNKQILSDVIERTIGEPVRITCVLNEDKLEPEREVTPEQVATEPAIVQSDPEVTTISNIFGGAELLES